MLKKDIITRTIRLLRDAVSKIARQREAGELDAAEATLGRACTDHLALELPFVEEVPLAQLLAFFTVDTQLDVARVIVAGELLEQAAALSAQRGDSHAAQLRGRKSLALFLHGFLPLPDRELREYAAKIINLFESDPDWEAPPQLLLLLVRAHEVAGQFASAEDLIFGLVDAAVPDALEQALALYGRLLRLADDELEQGGLPRAEVEESLAELRRKQGA